MKMIIKHILCVLSVVAFVGCDRAVEISILEPQSVAPDTLYAEFDEECSRTYIEDNRYLRWSAGDEISYFHAITYNMHYRFDGNTGASGGTFSKLTTDLVTGNGLDNCYAVYPYAASTSISEEGVISFAYPETQYYAEESFGLGANVMVAMTKSKDDNVLRFKNACGYLKIQLYGDASIQRIELSGNRGEAIVGDATIVMLEDIPQMSIVRGSATLTLDCASGVALSKDEPTVFWFAMPATTFSEGITITIYDSLGCVMTKSTTKQVEIERNMIQPMAAFEFEGESQPLSVAALAGVWHLTQWYDVEPSFEVYMDVDASGSITLYQRIESRYWSVYASSAEITNDVISGVYSDGVVWGTSYEVSIDDDLMTWVAQNDATDISVYTRSELPADMPTESTRAANSDNRFL